MLSPSTVPNWDLSPPGRVSPKMAEKSVAPLPGSEVADGLTQVFGVQNRQYRGSYASRSVALYVFPTLPGRTMDDQIVDHFIGNRFQSGLAVA